MRDFNFFSPYIDTKRAKKVHTRYAIMAGALVFIILTGIFAWSFYTINSLEREISEKEKFLNSPEIKKNLEEYENLRAIIEKLDKYYSTVINVNETINKKDILRTSVLDNIADAMPQETFLQSISGLGGNIELICTSSNKNSIAELERNLKGMKGIDIVHVMGTKRIENYFTSSIMIKLKDVEVSEAD